MKDFFSKKTVLVTGHTGFKGSWLTAWLLEMGAEVVGMSLDPRTSPSHFEAGGFAGEIADLRIDVRDSEKVSGTVVERAPDFLFHLAAQPLVKRSFADPWETYSTNVLGTLNLLEALRKIGKPCVAVFVTSDKSYDNREWVWGYRENDRLGGTDPYSASKGAAELAIRSHTRSFFPAGGAVKIGVGRAGNVIGGGDWSEDRIVPDCVRACVGGQEVRLRNPASTRPWQHVLEPLSGYLALAASLVENPSLHGEPFNFGPPERQNHSVSELVRTLSEHWSGIRWKAESEGETLARESNLLKLNCDKALLKLGWHAVLDFGETAETTAGWYRNFYDGAIGARELTRRQIRDYVAKARQRGLAWTR